MSILANKDTRVVIQGGAAGVNAARRMAEFCYLIKRPLNVEAFVYPPDAGKTNEVPYGSGLIAIPIYKTIAEATKNHSTINTSLVYIGADRAMKGGMEALDDSHIKVVSMITEGVPEKDAKLLGTHARKLGKVFNGPSSIGIISAGACRLGVIGGRVRQPGPLQALSRRFFWGHHEVRRPLQRDHLDLLAVCRWGHDRHRHRRRCLPGHRLRQLS